jgi:hypothetical protein
VRRVRLLLDANVLVDAQARDFFLTSAEFRIVDVRWSDQILDEVARALTGRLGLSDSAARRLLDALSGAFPYAGTEGFEHLVESIELPDPDDRHVAAAAIHDECDLLVTENVDDFPDHFADPLDILVASIDEAVSYVVGVAPDLMASVVEAILRRLNRPAFSLDEYLERLSSRAPLGAALLGTVLGIDEYVRILADMSDSEAPGSPQEAVRDLLASVDSGNADAVMEMVHPDLAARLTGASNPAAASLLAVVAEILADVRTTDGWGFATAKRPVSVDTELVKLVRAGDRPLIVWEPTKAQGHLFRLRRAEERWTLIDLDDTDPGLSQV